MAIPTAVSPSVLTPGLYLTVDLLAGTASPGTGTLRVALMATKSSSGDLTDNTEVRPLGGTASAITAFGQGTTGHLAAKDIYARYPAAVIDAISPAAGAGTATLNVTASGTPTGNNVVDFDIMGVAFEVPWLASETADEFKANAIDAINERTDSLACTASSGGTGIIQIDSKVAGNVGNDIKVQATLRLAQTGTEAIAGAATPTNLAGGTTDPDLTTALSNLQGQEYHYILAALSNTDVANVASANNCSKIKSHIDSLNTGLNAKLQQFIVGYSGTLALAVASAPNSNSCGNSEIGQLMLCINGRGLPAQLGAGICAERLAAISLDPAANIIGNTLPNYVGAVDKIADKPTSTESEQAIGAGVSLTTYNAQDFEVIARSVTTHSQDDVGGPDQRLLDTQNVDGAYIVSRDIRDNLPLEFPNAKITPDVAPGEDPPPARVIEERDIKSYIISRLRFWQGQGVVVGSALDDAIEDGTLIVQVNGSDPTQVDIVMPFEIIQPLAKFGVVAQRQPS